MIVYNLKVLFFCSTPIFNLLEETLSLPVKSSFCVIAEEGLLFGLLLDLFGLLITMDESEDTLSDCSSDALGVSAVKEEEFSSFYISMIFSSLSPSEPLMSSSSSL